MAIPFTLALVFLSFVGVNAARVVLTLYALTLDATPATVGVLGGMFYVFPLLLSLPIGAMADRRGARGLLYAGGVSATSALLLPYFVPAVPAFFVAAALSGLSLAFFHVTLQSLIGVLSKPEDRPRNFSNFSLAGSMSNFFGPIIAGLTIDHAGHAIACLAVAVLSFLTIVLLLIWGRLIPVPKPQPPREQNPVQPLKSAEVWLMLAASGLVQIGTDIFQFYLPIYGHSIGLSASAIGATLAVFAGAAFVVRLFLARMVKRWPAETLLAYSFYIGVIGFALVPFFHNAYLLALAAGIFGLGMGIGTPLTVMMMFSRSTEGRSGRTLGLRLTSNNVVRVTGPMIFGAVSASLGLLSVFWISAALLGAGGVYAQWRSRKTP